MKLILSFLLIAISLPALAQNAKINGYAEYVFDDNVDSYYDNTSYYNGKIKGGFQWGVGLEYMLHPSYGLELLYLRQDTKAEMEYYSNGIKNTDFDLGINYIMLAGNRYFRKPGSKVEGYGGMMLGADVIKITNPDDGKSGTKTFFAWGIRLGANIWASEKVAIKLQGKLLSAVQSAGGGFYFGTGGASAGLSSYSTLYQWGLGGGIAIRLGNEEKK